MKALIFALALAAHPEQPVILTDVGHLTVKQWTPEAFKTPALSL